MPNVIPERVEILGSLRTLDDETRATLKDRIEEIVHGVKELSQTSIHLRFETPIDAASVHNPAVVPVAAQLASVFVVRRRSDPVRPYPPANETWCRTTDAF